MKTELAQSTPSTISQTDFGPLALWLALTTNQKFVLSTPAQSISDTTTVDLTTVQSFLNSFADEHPSTLGDPLTTKAEVFKFVRAQFQELAKDIMGDLYPTGGCPSELEEIGRVAEQGTSQRQPEEKR